MSACSVWHNITERPRCCVLNDTGTHVSIVATHSRTTSANCVPITHTHAHLIFTPTSVFVVCHQNLLSHNPLRDSLILSHYKPNKSPTVPLCFPVPRSVPTRTSPCCSASVSLHRIEYCSRSLASTFCAVRLSLRHSQSSMSSGFPASTCAMMSCVFSSSISDFHACGGCESGRVRGLGSNY